MVLRTVPLALVTVVAALPPCIVEMAPAITVRTAVVAARIVGSASTVVMLYAITARTALPAQQIVEPVLCLIAAIVSATTTKPATHAQQTAAPAQA